MKKNLTLLMAVLGIALGINAQIPTDGLVSHYPFNGNANDESGNGNNGTVNGATLTSDRFGNANGAYSFDGVNDYIEVLNSTSLNTQMFTISSWVFCPDIPLENGEILLKGDYPYNYGINKNSDNNFSGFYNSNGSYMELISPESVNKNYWYHITLTHDGTTAKLYIDNEFIGSNTNSNVTVNADNLYIGSYFGTSLFFTGIIDDTRIYNRALTETEIQELYEEGGWSTLNQGLVAHYPFNGNADDASGNGNDGTVTGATLTADRFGNANSAYSFDGASNYIQCVSNITNIDTITISGWAKSNSPLGGQFVHIGEDDNIFCNGIGVGKGGTDSVMGLNTWNLYNGNNLVSLLSCVNYYDSGYLLDSISWFNFAIIKTNNTISYYVNGTFIGSSPVSNANNPINKIFLGTSGLLPGAKTFYNGSLDDIRIYNRAVSESEILSLYQERFCFETIYDTIQVFDTTFVTVHDTITTEVLDTVLVSVTDTLIIDAVLTGIDPPDNHNTLKIYPNPAREYITINTGSYSNMQNYSIKIVNMIGATVFETLIQQPVYEINLSTWTGTGIYLVKIFDNTSQEISVKKIVLQ